MATCSGRWLRSVGIGMLALSFSCSVASAATVRIRMGTVAPKGSVWTEGLEEIRQEWKRISDGQVDLRIYPGGVLGDGPEMVRKVRSGTLQAVALSAIGLSRIDEGVGCLSVPMMFESDDELDFVRDRIAPQLEQRLEQRGFVVLNWAEGGWVRFFTKKPARVPDDIRKMKLFTSAGDPDSERLWKEFGFNVVPMSLTDMATALQTGMIEAFDVPPLFALLDRTYSQAKYMVDVAVAPVVGGTVIDRETWQRVPERFRPEMLEVSKRIGRELRLKVRKLEADSIREMEKRGLEIVRLDDATLEVWRREAEERYPALRGRYAPAELFDQALALRNQYRESPTR